MWRGLGQGSYDIVRWCLQRYGLPPVQATAGGGGSGGGSGEWGGRGGAEEL